MAKRLEHQALVECNRPGLLDPVNVGLMQLCARLAVKFFKNRDDHNRRRNPVGDLHQIADSFREALFRIIEVPEVFDLVNEIKAEIEHSPSPDQTTNSNPARAPLKLLLACR